MLDPKLEFLSDLITSVSLTHGSSQEERATTELVDPAGAADGNEQLEHVFSSIQASLGSLIGYTSTLVNEVGIIADQRIAGVLRDDTQRDEEYETMTVARCLEKVEIATILLVLILKGNSILDLSVLELNCRVIAVPVGMVLGEDLESVFVTLLGH